MLCFWVTVKASANGMPDPTSVFFAMLGTHFVCITCLSSLKTADVCCGMFSVYGVSR
jgi:hypothetical protein